jgi:hypothetical protein
MANYVWTAKNKFGNSVVREISASTIEESKSTLLAEGCTDLVLKGDEIMDVATAGMPRSVRFLGEEHKVTEAEKLKHRGNPAPTFFSALWQVISQQLMEQLLQFAWSTGWTREQITARVRELIVDQLGVKPDFSDDANFVKDLGVD